MDNKLTIKNNPKSRRGFLGDIGKWIGGTALLAATANIFTSNKIKADPASTNSADPYIGEIMMVGFNFAPRGWATCEGQLLAINQYSALFSLLGTTFGGDGRTTFGLPDLRGRVPIGVGNGPGLPNTSWGARGGTPTNILQLAQLPSHNHVINANNETVGRGVLLPATNNFPAQNGDGSGNYASTADTTMNTGVVSNTGGNQPINNMQPYLGIYFAIALVGVFPSRS